MASHEEVEQNEMLESQAPIWKLMLSFSDSMVLKSALQLGILDTIHSHMHPISLSQLVSRLTLSSPDNLTRVMRVLVRNKILTIHVDGSSGESLYGLTSAAKFLLQDSPMSLAPMLLMENHPLLLHPWHFISSSIKKGGDAFEIAHGCSIWELASKDSEFNRLFNGGLACTARIAMGAILSGYKEGFKNIESLVDVGGGTGEMVAEIVKNFSNIKVGINFDLPHVVATTSAYPGITHVGGDMFKEVPLANAVFMKWVLHDWNDDDCIRILTNCRKAIPKSTGKIIIADIVLQPEGEGPMEDARFAFDMLMMAHGSGGKERTEFEWKWLLQEAGFPRFKFISIPSLISIIEAYPE